MCAAQQFAHRPQFFQLQRLPVFQHTAPVKWIFSICHSRSDTDTVCPRNCTGHGNPPAPSGQSNTPISSGKSALRLRLSAYRGIGCVRYGNSCRNDWHALRHRYGSSPLRPPRQCRTVSIASCTTSVTDNALDWHLRAMISSTAYSKGSLKYFAFPALPPPVSGQTPKDFCSLKHHRCKNTCHDYSC